MLFKALGVNFQELDLRINKLGKINFYQLYPIYLEELNYKKEHTAKELINLIDDNDIMPILNLNRKNYGTNKK